MKFSSNKLFKYLNISLSLIAFVGCSGNGGMASGVGNVVVSSACSIDGANGQTGSSVELPIGVVTFTGWGADSTTGTVPEKLSIQLLDEKGNVALSGAAKLRTSRPDVVKAFNQPGYEKSGFEATLDSKALQPGTYGLSIVMTRTDGAALCPSDKKIILKL